ncbi:MAG: response regulator [Candidatus Adiutrix sp.]|jgi:CheY-like chemotaxis protein|nr:response regulator [Candidatus Adiutrix sp.]
MARILLSLADESLTARAAEALETGRHEQVTHALGELRLEGLTEAAKALAEADPDVVIMDYRPEDAAGVKLMQTVFDLAPLEHHPAFIFIEGPGQGAAREEVLMAINEGAQAFLPADFQPAALSNYIERALHGPGRLRPRARNSHDADGAILKLEETLGQIRTRSLGFQKVVGHLLATPITTQNRKVLVVSDSSYQREMLKKILEDYNFQVLTASAPPDGLNVALSEKPRIIVSDLELEGSTGLEFCQSLKFTHKLVPCHFVICTANQTKFAKVMSPGNGVDDCLLKPSGTHDTLDFVSRVAMGLLL